MNITPKLNAIREGLAAAHVQYLERHDLDKFDVLANKEYFRIAGIITYHFNAVASNYLDLQWLRDNYYAYQHPDLSNARAVMIDVGFDLYLTLKETGVGFADRYGQGDNPNADTMRPDCPLTRVVERMQVIPRTNNPQHVTTLIEALDDLLPPEP